MCRGWRPAAARSGGAHPSGTLTLAGSRSLSRDIEDIWRFGPESAEELEVFAAHLLEPAGLETPSGGQEFLAVPREPMALATAAAATAAAGRQPATACAVPPLQPGKQQHASPMLLSSWDYRSPFEAEAAAAAATGTPFAAAPASGLSSGACCSCPQRCASGVAGSASGGVQALLGPASRIEEGDRLMSWLSQWARLEAADRQGSLGRDPWAGSAAAAMPAARWSSHAAAVLQGLEPARSCPISQSLVVSEGTPFCSGAPPHLPRQWCPPQQYPAPARCALPAPASGATRKRKREDAPAGTSAEAPAFAVILERAVSAATSVVWAELFGQL